MNAKVAAGLLGAWAGLCLPVHAQVIGYGVQASVGLVKGGDLHATAGSGLPLAIGAQADVLVRQDRFLVKPRIEAWFFSQAHQSSAGATLSQQVDTKVQAQMAGADVLYRFAGKAGKLAAGAGLYLVRWSVDSTDRMGDAAGDTLQQSGTSSWVRPGFGLIGTWTCSRHLDLEARWITSNEGYQKPQINLFLGGVAWRF